MFIIGQWVYSHNIHIAYPSSWFLCMSDASCKTYVFISVSVYLSLFGCKGIQVGYPVKELSAMLTHIKFRFGQHDLYRTRRKTEMFKYTTLVCAQGKSDKSIYQTQWTKRKRQRFLSAPNLRGKPQSVCVELIWVSGIYSDYKISDYRSYLRRNLQFHSPFLLGGRKVVGWQVDLA